MKGRILIVAGSDSGGGAGIQADLKTVTALGGYGATAITALTAQNTKGVFGVVGVAPEFIQLQMTLVLDDIGADAVKTGMLADTPTIEAVSAVLARRPDRVPLVVDPVMVAESGDSLLAPEAVASLKTQLIPHATLLTPNLYEAEQLTGRKVDSVEAMAEAARVLLSLGPEAVLVKGGHLEGTKVTDLLATREACEAFESFRIPTRHTHGTGCTLASAIATGLAQGMGLRDAVVRARAYLYQAIRHAPGLGEGKGPLDHMAGADPTFGFE